MTDILERATKALEQAGWAPVDQVPEEWKDGRELTAWTRHDEYAKVAWQVDFDGDEIAYAGWWDLDADQDGHPTHLRILDTPDQPDPLAAVAAELLDEVKRLREELARKSTVAEAQWEIIESLKKENAELRAAQDIKLDAAYRNGLNQAARIISQYEMENKTTDGIKHVAAISARLTDQLIEARKERKALAILAQHAPQAGKEG